MKNIVLIGLPGCGKTTLGEALAQKQKMRYIDLDHWIETQENMKIADLFSAYGESYFRMMETKAAAYAAAETSLIVSAGGGIVLKEENMAMLGAGGIIVFIDRDPAAIINDIETGNRPLLKDGAEKVKELYDQRIGLYRKYADYIIKNESITSSLDELEEIVTIAQRSIELAVIGDPIAHSLSPEIHLTVLERICEHVSYERIRIEKGKLGDEIGRLQQYYDGFNITMPHKADIMEYLTETDTDAQIYHSVNTAVKRTDGFVGYNTDGSGFAAMIYENGGSFEGKHIVVLGAGGAAGTIAIKAAQEGAAIVSILTRTPAKAEHLRNKITKLYPDTTTNLAEMTAEQLDRYCTTADMLVNGTPLGMHGSDEFKSLDFLKSLPKNALVCDLIYHPMKTLLYLKAEALGLQVIGGIQMLIDQALIADELYIGHELNFASMQNKVIDALIRKGKLS